MGLSQIIATALDIMLCALMGFGLFFADDGGDKAVKPVQFGIIVLLFFNIWLIWYK